LAELTPQPTSILSLYGMYADDKLYVNRRYQRKLVWTLEEKQKLIESILKKYPVPAILVAEKEGLAGAYEIIDGLQRLQTIVSFIEGAFPTLDNRLFDLQYFPTAKGRMESGIFAQIEADGWITQKEASTLLDYSLALSVMRGATDAEVDDVFDRINTYGHRLSDQERRQAGVQNEFSTLVRKLASTIRGDASADVLLLSEMPSISVDLPTTKHGYTVKAEEVFWVNEGILRSTDLRDSMDEQCVADIAASIVTGEMVDRSKDYLDRVYDRDSDTSGRIISALEVYGSDKVANEIKFCIEQISLVCAAGSPIKLRDIVFSKRNTNGFPSVFVVILMAFHALFVDGKKHIADYDGVKEALKNLDKRIGTARSSTTPKERKKNVNMIRAFIETSFVDGDPAKEIYDNHSASDIETAIRRSEIELSGYELKQGIVSLGPNRAIDEGAVEKILATITAIANNGKGRSGKLILGVTDKDADTTRVKDLDGVDARLVGKRHVVGINREAKALGITVESYHGLVRDRIKHSQISEPLRSSILSSIDYNSFYGYGIIVVSVPTQNELSFYNDEVYWREGDQTTKAIKQKQVADLAKRF
jgi:hypothetical protein